MLSILAIQGEAENISLSDWTEIEYIFEGIDP